MYIIIGASSFIGVYTATLFHQKNEKILVCGREDEFKEYYDSLGVDFVNLDLINPKDFEKLPKNGVEAVILIAGLLPASENADLKKSENADMYIKVNTIGTINTLEYCRKNGIKRLINTISFADIAKSLTCKTPVSEDEPRNFYFHGDHAAYVISKNAAADIMQYYNEQHNMLNAWFRLPPVYGVGPHGFLKVNGIIKKSGLQIFIDKAKSGDDIEVFGNLSRDVVYVKDVAMAYYLAVKSHRTKGIYNISSGHVTTLLEQAEACADVFCQKKKSKIIFKDVSNNGDSYLLSIEKAKKDFGYAPLFNTFEKMMRDYYFEEKRGVYNKLFENRKV